MYMGIPCGNMKSIYCPRRGYKIPENWCGQCVTKECKNPEEKED